MANSTYARSLIDTIRSKRLDFVGLSETRLNKAQSKNFYSSAGLCSGDDESLSYDYWSDYNTTHPLSTGVCLLISKRYSKFVSCIHTPNDPSIRGRFIAADLHLPGRQKLCVLNVYVPDSATNIANHTLLLNEIKKLIVASENKGFRVIVCGDFNADPDIYEELISARRTISRKYRLLHFLNNKDYYDVHPTQTIDGQTVTFPTWKRVQYNGTLQSRIDLIWLPGDLIHEYLYSEVWYPPVFESRAGSDHKFIIAYISTNELFSHLPNAHIKRSGQVKKVPDFARMNDALWKDYTEATNGCLITGRNEFQYDASDLPSRRINQMWSIIAHIAKRAGEYVFPTKRVGPIRHRNRRPRSLLKSYDHLRHVNTLLSHFSHNNLFLGRLPSYVYWKEMRSYLLKTLSPLYENSFDSTTLPEILTIHNCFDVKKSLFDIQRVIKSKCQLDEEKWLVQTIEERSRQRCDNYHDNKSAFISSALGKEKRIITLDRIMVDVDGNDTLITDPDDIKREVNKHFQTIAGLPPHNLPPLNERWTAQYAPRSDINSSIYDTLMSPPSKEEWQSVLTSFPNDKAPGPSGITYEMLKKFGSDAADFFHEFICFCLQTSTMPEAWNDAIVYPIPKPHEWQARLKNTRPITLLETARKALIKLLNNRLSVILADHNVLKGGNFAGLPGGSCHPPIQILESIIDDAKKNSKDVFILSQDISKAYDSVDIRMLNKAMTRIKLPDELSKNREWPL